MKTLLFKKYNKQYNITKIKILSFPKIKHELIQFRTEHTLDLKRTIKAKEEAKQVPANNTIGVGGKVITIDLNIAIQKIRPGRSHATFKHFNNNLKLELTRLDLRRSEFTQKLYFTMNFIENEYWVQQFITSIK